MLYMNDECMEFVNKSDVASHPFLPFCVGAFFLMKRKIDDFFLFLISYDDRLCHSFVIIYETKYYILLEITQKFQFMNL